MNLRKKRSSYGHLVPQTTAGRVMCLIFCLIGIPLILVTIADIGRFLSIYVVLFYQHYAKFVKILSTFLSSIADRFDRWRRCRRCRRSAVGALRQTSSITYDAANALINILAQRRGTGANYDLDNDDADDDEEGVAKCSLHRASASAAGRRSGANFADRAGQLMISSADDRAEAFDHPMDENLMDNDDTEATNIDNEDLSMDPVNKQVSVVFILIILLGYTLFGAMLLQLWENWTLFEAFYYCVITVLTIGFGDYIPQNEKFMIITLFYIIGGLVVTTMCIDLVGSQYIKKIHYFGRNIVRLYGRAIRTIKKVRGRREKEDKK
uniref:Potassium channel domain-containing protein n=1 Tax=Romanomermis culicivorax TaxID=13658 RepID=A0A915KI16_ROMCU